MPCFAFKYKSQCQSFKKTRIKYILKTCKIPQGTAENSRAPPLGNTSKIKESLMEQPF